MLPTATTASVEAAWSCKAAAATTTSVEAATVAVDTAVAAASVEAAPATGEERRGEEWRVVERTTNKDRGQ